MLFRSQTVTITGTRLSTSTDLILRYLDGDGNLRAVNVNPTFASPDGTSAQFVLPNYVNSNFTLELLGSSVTPTLQVVPTVIDYAMTPNGSLHIRGLGLVEGNNTTYNLGGQTIVDPSIASSAPANAYSDGADLVLGTNVGLGDGQFRITTSAGTTANRPWNLIYPNQGSALYDLAVDSVNNVEIGRAHV